MNIIQPVSSKINRASLDTGITWEDLARAERTPGAAAVSHDEGEAGDVENIPSPVPPSSFPSECQTDSIPATGEQVTTRVVGFNKLKSLLQPVHRYFQDKLAWVKGFHLYQDTPERVLAYPDVKAEHKDNPYRRHQLCHKASARTYKRIRQYVERNKLDDFMVAKLSITMPRFISEYLAGQDKRGRTLAWGLFEKFWSEDLPVVIGQQIELASHTNLHPWSSKNPLQPHYHFHSLIPNYGYVGEHFLGGERYPDKCSLCGGSMWVKTEKGVQCAHCYPVKEFDLKRWNWHRQRGGRLVPFSDEQRVKLNELWANRLERFCKRHGLQKEWLEHVKETVDRYDRKYAETGMEKDRYSRSKVVDVFISYVDEWKFLLHALNYNGRGWAEDFCEYSNDNPDCPDPPAWLVGYDNRARCKGWWCSLKKITTEDKAKEKVSPYTGKSMNYISKVSFNSLLEKGNGQISSVEFVRGLPVEGQIPEEWVAWLKEVMTGQADYLEDEESL